MYVTPIQRTSSETMHGEESSILSFAGIHCWERGHVDEGVSSTLDGSKIFAELLQKTVNKSMGIIRYLNQMSRGIFN